MRDDKTVEGVGAGRRRGVGGGERDASYDSWTKNTISFIYNDRYSFLSNHLNVTDSLGIDGFFFFFLSSSKKILVFSFFKTL